MKNSGKDDFKYLSQEFDSDVLDLVKEKDFIFMSVWVVLKILKKNYQAKKSFMARWKVKKLVINRMNMFLRFRIDLKWKRWKTITTCT